jgi:hypothetical protein
MLAHAELADEAAERRTMQAVERCRVADIAGQRADAVAIDDRAQPLRDALERLVPRDRLEAPWARPA